MRFKTRWLFILLAATLLLAACGGEKQETKELGARGAVDTTTGVAAPAFEWNIISKPLLSFYYEPDDSLAFRADALATRIDQVLFTITTAYGIEEPEPIEFYCYRDSASFTHYTGRTEQFYVGNKFYYPYGPNYGPLLSQYVYENLPFEHSQFNFMNEGMVLLLDFSGRNYNQATYMFLEGGNLNPAAEITDNTLYEQISSSRRAIEAASLLSYIIDTHGLEKMQELFHSEADNFETAADEVLGESLDDLQQGWVEYLPKHTNEMERIRELESNQ